MVLGTFYLVDAGYAVSPWLSPLTMAHGST
jgi:hypothetical protein